MSIISFSPLAKDNGQKIPKTMRFICFLPVRLVLAGPIILFEKLQIMDMSKLCMGRSNKDYEDVARLGFSY